MTPLRVVWVLCVIGLVSSAWVRLPPAFGNDTPRSLLGRGMKQLEQGDFAGAQKSFDQMNSACGKDEFCIAIASYFFKGRCLLETDRINEALDLLRKAEGAFVRLNKPYERAVTRLMIGRGLSQLGQYDEALNHLQTVEPVFEKAGQSGLLSLFYSYLYKSKTYMEMFRFSEGKEMVTKAQGILDRRPDTFPDVRKLKIEAGLYEADILLRTQNFQAAKELYQKALEYYQSNPNPKTEARVFNSLGYIRELQAGFDEASGLYARALTLAEKSGSLLTQAEILNNMGRVHERRGDYQQALEFQEKCLSLVKRVGNPRLEAEALSSLGALSAAMGDYEKSLDLLRQALFRCKDKNWPDVEGTILHNLAFLIRDQGMLPQARDNLLQAVELAKKAGDRGLEAVSTMRLGNLYEYYGQFEQALDAYTTARVIQEKIGDRFFLSNTLADLADVMIRQISPEDSPVVAVEKFKEVAEKYTQAIAIRKKIGAPATEALCKAALGFIEKPQFFGTFLTPEQRASDLQSAGNIIRRAEEDLGSRSKPNKADKLLLDYVKVRYRLIQNNPREALVGFKALSDEARASKRLKYEFLARVGMGLCHEGLKELPQAEQAFREAVTIAEDIRDTLDPEGQRTFLHGEEVLGMKHVAANEGLVRVRAQRAQVAQNKDLWEKALRASEGTKLQAFSDRLVKMGLADFRNAVSFVDLENSALKDGEWTLVYDVTDSAVVGFLLHGRKIAHASRMDIRRQELEDLTGAVRRGLVDHAPGTLSEDQTGSLGQLSKSQWDYDALLASKKIYDSVVRPLVEKVPEKETLTVIPAGPLGEIPFEILVTNRSADSIPRGRAPKKDEIRFLVDRNPIVYYLSLSALTWARQKWEKSPTPKAKALIMAHTLTGLEGAGLDEEASHEKRADPRWVISRLHGLGMTEEKALGWTEGEIHFFNVAQCAEIYAAFEKIEEAATSSRTATFAKAVGSMFEKRRLHIYGGETDPRSKSLPRLYKGKLCDVYVGTAASLTQFRGEIKPQISEYGKLLFATASVHCSFSVTMESGPPALLLSMDPPCAFNFLTTTEIAKLSLNADVVVLRNFDVGIAFHVAGCRTVILGNWVNHASTTVAETFFRKLLEGKSKLQALQEARRELRTMENGKYSHPSFWAEFVMLGEAGSPSR